MPRWVGEVNRTIPRAPGWRGGEAVPPGPDLPLGGGRHHPRRRRGGRALHRRRLGRRLSRREQGRRGGPRRRRGRAAAGSGVWSVLG